jgi:hypothetical protein
MLMVCGFIRFFLTCNRIILHWALGLLLMLSESMGILKIGSTWVIRIHKQTNKQCMFFSIAHKGRTTTWLICNIIQTQNDEGAWGF